MQKVRMATGLRAKTAKRQRELAARHDELDRFEKSIRDGGMVSDNDDGARSAGGAIAVRYRDLLTDVFDATNDLITVLDERASRAARLRRLGAFLLLLVAFGGAVLVACELLAPGWLIAVLLLVASSVTLFLTARPGRTRRKRDKTAPGDAAGSDVAAPAPDVAASAAEGLPARGEGEAVGAGSPSGHGDDGVPQAAVDGRSARARQESGPAGEDGAGGGGRPGGSGAADGRGDGEAPGQAAGGPEVEGGVEQQH